MPDFTDEQILAFLLYQRAIGFPVMCGPDLIGVEFPLPEKDKRKEVAPDTSGIDLEDPQARTAVARFMLRHGWTSLPEDVP